MIHAKDTPLSVILSAALKGQVERVRTLFGKSLRTKGGIWRICPYRAAGRGECLSQGVALGYYILHHFSFR